MLSDETIRRLQGLEDATRKGYPIRNLYRLMCVKDLWMLAYANIRGNKGALTPGVDASDTLDGFSHARVDRIVESLRKGTYKPNPVRRENIPKPNGKTRPLGIPSGTDKLVQEVARIALERIYEPIFSDRAHGFRPDRSCHTALQEVSHGWSGVKWLIDVDIKGFFDNIDHEHLLGLLRNKIDDHRFVDLIEAWLMAGYVDNWDFHRTYSGTPQGGIISPLLANIVLNELDHYLEDLKRNFDKGTKRRENPEYRKHRLAIGKLRKRITAAKDDPAQAAELKRLQDELEERQQLARSEPVGDPEDPDFKRLKFVRYADDFVIGIIGSKEDAVQVMEKVKTFITTELHLEVNEDKTKIRHVEDGCRFLGYEIRASKPGKLVKATINGVHFVKRSTSGIINLYVPKDVPEKFAREHGYGDPISHRAMHRGVLIHSSEAEIVLTYNSELRGLANYYALADDVKAALNGLMDLGKLSLFKTLAAKRKSTLWQVQKELRRGPGEFILGYVVGGSIKALRVYTLKQLDRKKIRLAMIDRKPATAMYYLSRTELVDRLNAGVCEACGTVGRCEVHHARKLKDIERKQHKTFWDELMIARRRKTLVLCKECHILLHAGKLPDRRWQLTMESCMQ